MNNIVYSPLAVKAIAEGRKRHMVFGVRGQGEIPEEPFYKDEWWYEILKSEFTTVYGMDRVEMLKKKGFKVKELIIAHEAPKLLVEPLQENEENTPKRDESYPDMSFDVSGALEAITKVLGVVLAVIGFILITAIRLDPALIVVLEDDTWLEVASWYD